jgi:hypothetical protein
MFTKVKDSCVIRLVAVAPASRRDLTRYFTLFSFLRGQTLQELENRIGYRSGRLSSQGALIYKFVRLPEPSEFEVRGTSIWTQEAWQKDVAPKRAADLAASAPYHKATRVPSSDDFQKRNARESMSLIGGHMIVKRYPVDWQPIDETSAGYRHGSGIYQWRLREGVKIPGKLLVAVAPNDNVPWQAL